MGRIAFPRPSASMCGSSSLRRRSLRPQLKRDPLGCNQTLHVYSGPHDARGVHALWSYGWAPVVPRSHAPVCTNPCVGSILRAGRVHASGCPTQNGVTWLRFVGSWGLRSLRSIGCFRERDVLAGHVALQPNKRLKLAGALAGRIAFPRLRARSAGRRPCACQDFARSLSAIR